MHSLYFVNNSNNQQHTLGGHGNNLIQHHSVNNNAGNDNNNNNNNNSNNNNNDINQQNEMLAQQRTMRHRPQIEGVTEGLSHIVQWLIDTYEMAEGESLPRSIVYNHYQEFCTSSNVEPVNPASFGKLIRTVFAGLKTRRLGTRGHSKYHYFGIRIKSGSSLIGSTADTQQRHDHSLGAEHDESQNESSASNGKSVNRDGCSRKKLKTSTNSFQTSHNNNNNNNVTTNNDNNDANSPHNHHSNQIDDNHSMLQAYLGDFSNIVENNWIPLSESIVIESYNELVENPDIITIFEKLYKAHYQEIVESIFNLRFINIEKIWYRFWHPDETLSLEHTTDVNFKTLYRLTSSSNAFVEWIIQLDHNIYSAIETGLLPDLLCPVPRELNQEVRQFAKNVGPWMEKAVSDYETNFSSSKCKAARALGYTLRRYTALNHLATSARSVWDSKATMQQMYIDLSRVDLKDVQHQAALITRCDSNASEQIVSKFMILINSPKPSEIWHEWCTDLVKLKIRVDDLDSARHFMLKWNFYSSLIMKELTLRSSASFGSFHLIRLLFDEYIFYLIVCRLAQSHGKTPTQLLCEANSWIISDNNQTTV